MHQFDPGSEESTVVVGGNTKAHRRAPKPEPTELSKNMSAPSPIKKRSAPSANQQRLNVCDRMKQVDDGKVTLPLALQGLKLTAAMGTWDPALYSIGKKKKDYDYELAQEVARRGGFELNIDEVPRGNRTKSAWYHDTVRTYDIQLEHASEDQDKGLVSVPFFFLDASLVLVTRVMPSANAGLSVGVLFAPYDHVTWYVFLISCGFTALVYWYLECVGVHAAWLHGASSKSEDGDGDESSVDEDKAGLPGALYFSLMQLATVGSLTPKTGAGKVVAAAWSLFTLVFMAGYTANLASCLLALKQGSAPWATIDDVMSDKSPICVSEGYPTKWIKNNYPLLDTDKLVSSSIYPVKNMVLNHACEASLAWVTNYDMSWERQLYNPDCKLHRIGSKLTHDFAGWLVYADFTDKCTVLVRDVVRNIMQGMKEDGTLAKFFHLYLVDANNDRKMSCDTFVQESSEDIGALSFESMAGLFLMHLISCVVALVAAHCWRQPPAASSALQKPPEEGEEREGHPN